MCYYNCNRNKRELYINVPGEYVLAVDKIRENCTHCNGNSVYVFLFWELHGLSPNFHIHSPAEKADPAWEYIIRSQRHECGN